MRHLLSSGAVLTALLLGSLGAHAQAAPATPGEITLIAPGGVRPSVDQLIQDFQAKTGLKVKATSVPGGAAKKQATDGGPFDIFIIEPPYTEVIASGNVLPDSATPLAIARVVLVVKQGAPRPDISTPDAVKKVLLAAQSITFPDAATGAGAGVTVEEMFKTLGIEEQMRSKVRHAGGTAEIAKGNVEIGVTFYSQLEKQPGLDIIGPLPDDVAPPTVYGGFVSSHATDPVAAKQFLKYLGSPDAAAAYKAHGLTPDTKSK